jgi:hypothetical protein
MFLIASGDLLLYLFYVAKSEQARLAQLITLWYNDFSKNNFTGEINCALENHA